MRLRHVFNGDKAPSLLGLDGEDLQPREHRPHSVLLPYVVRAGAEGFLAADEGRVSLAVREVCGTAVHEIPEKLPAGGHLKAFNPLLLRHDVHRPGRWHRPRAALQAAGKLRNAIGVRHNHRERVRRRAEELRAEDHVPVGIAVGGCTEHRWRGGGPNLIALLVQAHRLHQLHGVREVGIGVAVPRGVGATKIFSRIRVGATPFRSAQLLLEDAPCVRTLHTTHGVVDEAEAGLRYQGLRYLVEIEALPQDLHVVLDAVKHFDYPVANLVSARGR
mmetsp:Transcript_104278/g.294056  ORF Transcript_104278/g.294056 Transcript_104278/m.294056 type:complete len:275 (-) Transcript_104278:1897-2721(-)